MTQTNLVKKIAKAIYSKTQHKLKAQEFARLHVLLDRYGGRVIAIQVNSLPLSPLESPVGYIEKMAQAHIMETKPANSELLKDILGLKNES